LCYCFVGILAEKKRNEETEKREETQKIDVTLLKEETAKQDGIQFEPPSMLFFSIPICYFIFSLLFDLKDGVTITTIVYRIGLGKSVLRLW
jgi:hypothetical protein